MSAMPHSNTGSEEPLIPLSVLGMEAGEVVPGMQELCRLTGVFFGVSMFAVTWLRDTVPTTIWSNGLGAETAEKLARWSHPALHCAQVVVTNTGAAAAACPAHAGSNEPGIGFFAAAPLSLADGSRVGALCIADTDGRPFSEEDGQRLQDFAAVASEALRGRKTLADVHRREQLLARAFRLAKVGGWEYNVATGQLMLSEQVLDIYGMDSSSQPSLDTIMRRIYPGDALIDTREDFARLIREGKGYDSRRRIQRLDGSSRWIHVLAEPEFHDGKVVRVHGLVEDITDEVESQRRFHELAYTDKLTGLPNRGAFLLELGRHFGRRDRIVLTAIDVDGFKDVNDTIGHHAGDQLLTEIGRRITAYFPVGTFVARVGSNEFTVIAASKDALMESIVAQVDELRLQLKEPVHYAEHALSVSVSIGLCEAPAQAADADQLVRSTDIALYQAKKSGGDRTVVFEPDMRNKLQERVQLLRDVRRGIQRQEFILYYQPIYDMQTQMLSGFEALMRWSRPEKGILPPSHFSAAFDDQVLAPQLGDEALRGAFAQMRKWMDKGFDFKRVSVNVAAAQFYPVDLAAHILGLLDEYGLSPAQLNLEITESVYLGQGANAVEDALRALHDAGVGIALDDFGTGYASLSQLQRFPIDSLKIDKSFVQNPDAGSIVDAIIALGTSLNMQTVAEGVESRAHVDMLLKRGCRYGQGYYLGKPMPAEFYA
jgi:diguanylate cyclase (GGDEF)-like protein/PAS domain S-box-containing protein